MKKKSASYQSEPVEKRRIAQASAHDRLKTILTPLEGRTMAVSFSPFTFHLLPSTRCLKVFLLLLSGFCLPSCSFNPRLQGEGETYLQGQWQQDTSAVQRKMLTYSLHNIRFSCDSFYLTVSTFTKVNYGTDTCMRTGSWAEYIKGTYRQRNDTLHLAGNFCNAKFEILQKPGCFRNGPYREDFKIKHTGDSVVSLTGASVALPVKLRLNKRTICVPKPI